MSGSMIGKTSWMFAVLVLITNCGRGQNKNVNEVKDPVSPKVSSTQGELSPAKAFGNESGYAWAITPQGKFECRCDASTKYLQVLTLGGRTIFQDKGGPDGIIESDTIASGITEQNIGCPTILSNRNGFVVIVRDTRPPSYGIQGYAIIDFNEKDLPLTILGEGQRPEDGDRISKSDRIKWSEDGLTLRYFGYKMNEESGVVNSPKPNLHETRFDFGAGVARQVR
jgi:hypothetical protein